MEKLRMLEMGTVVMGGGIAPAPPSGNHIALFEKALFTPS
jgi:hypothetical protein